MLAVAKYLIKQLTPAATDNNAPVEARECMRKSEKKKKKKVQ